jgi:tetratricopeptide (TPR) repeat protein
MIHRGLSSIVVLFLVLILGSCSESKKEIKEFEAISFLGDTLVRRTIPESIQKEYKRKLTDTRMEAKAHPDSEIALIWYGRRLAYMGYFRKAIEVYTSGLEKFPDSYKLLRHRGHRYITVREFDRAVADLSRAAVLSGNTPLEIEPDGIPNKLNQPLTTTQWNIYYHLGLAYYLLGDWEQAKQSFQVCISIGNNDDVLVAASDWLYMIDHRLGQDSLAEIILSTIPDSLNIIENGSYLKRIQLYKGVLSPHDLLDANPESADYSLTLATQGYGVGNWYLSRGDTTEAMNIFQSVLESENWAAFGYIASEADVYRLTE